MTFVPGPGMIGLKINAIASGSGFNVELYNGMIQSRMISSPTVLAIMNSFFGVATPEELTRAEAAVAEITTRSEGAISPLFAVQENEPIAVPDNNVVIVFGTGASGRTAHIPCASTNSECRRICGDVWGIRHGADLGVYAHEILHGLGFRHVDIVSIMNHFGSDRRWTTADEQIIQLRYSRSGCHQIERDANGEWVDRDEL